MRKILLFLSLFFVANNALACASGCGVSMIGSSSLIPNREGGTAFLQNDNLYQSRNWEKRKKSSGHNHDRRIETQTVTAGAQYMFNRKFGAAIRMPYVTRYKKEFDHHEGDIRNRNSDIGDIRINGIYSGFFDDTSTGITFGLKLPTGQTNARGIERGDQIGTGSTDTILGAYHIGAFGKSNFGYFMQASWERPFITHQYYTPGYEISASAGSYYNAGQFGIIKKLAPMLQFIGTKKGQDSGMNGGDHNFDSGYSMMFFAPGIEIAFEKFKIYADVEFPIYRAVNGAQLVPQNIYKLILGYNF